MTALEGYGRYVAWCKAMRMKPADFDTWRRELAKISEAMSDA